MNRNTLLKITILIALFVFSVGTAAAQTPEETAEPTAPVVTLEITGQIEAVDGTTITLYGQPYDTSEALIDDDVRLVVGEVVELYVEMRGGQMTVTLVDDIDRDDNPAQIEIYGIVEALDETTITIGGLVIDTTSAVFEDMVAVGEGAEVYAVFRDGSWVATRIDDDDLGDNDSSSRDDSRDFWADRDYDYELRGTLQEIGDGFIIVNERTIEAGRIAFDDDVVVGMLVEVEFYLVGGELVSLYVDDLDDLDYDYDYDLDDMPAGTATIITAAEAAAIALEVFPNATVSEIDLYVRSNGRVVWEVELSNRFEIYVDAVTGIRIEIEDYRDGRRGDDDDWNEGRDDNDDWNEGRDDDRDDNWDDDDDDNWDDDDDDNWDDDDDDDDWDDDDDDDDDD